MSTNTVQYIQSHQYNSSVHDAIIEPRPTALQKFELYVTHFFCYLEAGFPVAPAAKSYSVDPIEFMDGDVLHGRVEVYGRTNYK